MRNSEWSDVAIRHIPRGLIGSACFQVRQCGYLLVIDDGNQIFLSIGQTLCSGIHSPKGKVKTSSDLSQKRFFAGDRI